MANIYEWTKDTEKMSDEDLQKMADALEVLKGWPLFNKEYADLRIIRTIIAGTRLDRIIKGGKE